MNSLFHSKSNIICIQMEGFTFFDFKIHFWSIMIKYVLVVIGDNTICLYTLLCLWHDDNVCFAVMMCHPLELDTKSLSEQNICIRSFVCFYGQMPLVYNKPFDVFTSPTVPKNTTNKKRATSWWTMTVTIPSYII